VRLGSAPRRRNDAAVRHWRIDTAPAQIFDHTHRFGTASSSCTYSHNNAPGFTRNGSLDKRRPETRGSREISEAQRALSEKSQARKGKAS
jgi:hypothetical protein